MILIYFLAIFIEVFNSAILNIDLGTQFIKVSVTKTGKKPIDIVLDESSERKSRNAIAFTNDNIHYANDALVEMSFDSSCGLFHPHTLIGHSTNSFVVQDYLKKYNHLNITEDSTGTLIFQSTMSKHIYSIDEAFALLINYTITYSTIYNGYYTNNIILSVPIYYTMNQRLAISKALEIINVNLVSIIDSTVALAYSFSIHGIKFLDSNSKNYLFLDVGASQVSSSIIEAKKLENVPIIKFLSHTYKEDIAGNEFTICLAKVLHNFHKKLYPTKSFPFWNSYQLAKLYNDFEEIKKTFSTNNEVMINIEKFDGINSFKATMNRREYLENCDYLNKKIIDVIDESIELAALTRNNIQSVILMGGGTRPHSLDQKLIDNFQDRVLKIFNTDESICYGSALYAAKLTPGLKLIPVEIVRSCWDSIEAFYKKTEKLENNVLHTPTNKVLFKYGDLTNSTKILSIKNQINNLKIIFSSYTGARNSTNNKYNIFDVEIDGIEEILNQNPGSLNHIVRLYISLNTSNIIQINKAELLLTLPPEQSTLEKIGSVISNFISSGNEDKNNETSADNDAFINSTSTEKKVEALDENNSTAASNSTIKQTDQKKNLTKLFGLKYSIKNIRANVLNDEKIKSSNDKIKQISENIQLELRRQMIINDLLTLVYDSEDKLLDDSFDKYISESEKILLTDVITKIKTWYDTKPDETLYSEFKQRLDQLEESLSPPQKRIEESIKLIESINSFKSLINTTNNFINNTYKNVPQQYLSEIETDLAALKNLMETTEKSIDESWQIQSSLSPLEEPVLTSTKVYEANQKFDKQFKDLTIKMSALYKKAMDDIKENEKKVKKEPSTKAEEDSQNTDNEYKTEETVNDQSNRNFEEMFDNNFSSDSSSQNKQSSENSQTEKDSSYVEL